MWLECVHRCRLVSRLEGHFVVEYEVVGRVREKEKETMRALKYLRMGAPMCSVPSVASKASLLYLYMGMEQINAILYCLCEIRSQILTVTYTIHVDKLSLNILSLLGTSRDCPSND